MRSTNRIRLWTPEEDELLRKLVFANASPLDIAMRLERSISVVKARAHRLVPTVLGT
jgi:hypothetical protein